MNHTSKLARVAPVLAALASVIAGCGGGGSSTTNSGTIQQITGLSSPQSVFLAPSGAVLVVDQGVVKVFNPVGSVYQQGTSLTGTGSSPFVDPTDAVADSSGNIYVADAGTDKVYVFSSSGGNYTLVTSFGSQGSGSGQFLQPTSIAVDSSQNVYVADTSNENVQVFKPSGGSYAYSSTLSSTTIAQPDSVAVDPSGHIIIADKASKTVYVVTSSDAIVATIGSSGTGAGQFSDPVSVATDAFGNVYVADPTNDAVDEFAVSGTTYTYARKVGSTASSLFQYASPIGVSVSPTSLVAVLDSSSKTVTIYPAGV